MNAGFLPWPFWQLKSPLLYEQKGFNTSGNVNSVLSFKKTVLEDGRSKDFLRGERLKCIGLRMSSFFIGMV